MTILEFFAAVLRGLGMEPTPWRLAALMRWARMEGMPFEKTWNPLATTRLSANTKLNLAFNIGHGAGNWNDVPVRVYATAQDGVTATVETLALSYYIDIRRCLREQTVYLDITLDDFATYVGSEAYGRALLTEWAELTEAKTNEVGLAEITAFLGGADAVRQWNLNGNSLVAGYVNIWAAIADLMVAVGKLEPRAGVSDEEVAAALQRIAARSLAVPSAGS